MGTALDRCLPGCYSMLVNEVYVYYCILFYVIHIGAITVYINTIVEHFTGNMDFSQNIKDDFSVLRCQIDFQPLDFLGVLHANAKMCPCTIIVYVSVGSFCCPMNEHFRKPWIFGTFYIIIKCFENLCPFCIVHFVPSFALLIEAIKILFTSTHLSKIVLS